MAVYYNEIDTYAAEWLRNLIKAGHIADGYVDNRSITDVRPEDLAGFTQCHFFAGIGVWSLALRNAGWTDDRPVWTGSCPCQPFSVAGNQLGMSDERHLAPVWLGLIKACKPPILFGEQVSDAIKKHWLDSLFDELEGEGYACGAAVLPACGVGAPHIRQRLTFGAYRLAESDMYRDRRPQPRGNGETTGDGTHLIIPRKSCGMADADNAGSQRGISGRQNTQRETEHGHTGRASTVSGLADTNGERLDRSGDTGQGRGDEHPDRSTISGLVDADGDQQRQDGIRRSRTEHVSPGRQQSAATTTGLCNDRRTGPDNSFWGGADWLGCKDGKFRPVESGTFPLADGVAARVGRLRAYGNAIVPQAATEFIIAFEGAIYDVNN